MFTNFARMLNNRKRGFTIIEMVVVIAIIGILSSVLIPNFSSTLTKADSAAKAANLNSVNKIAASAKVVAANGPMLDVTGAVVSNFGKEAASKTLKTTVYNAETQSFTALTKVKVDDASKPDRTLYYPVYGETAEEVAESLKAYDFVEYMAGKPELAKSISKKIAKSFGSKDKSDMFTEVYVINGSIALHSDVELTDALFIFLDGASLETNGNAFKCYGVAFVDTSADGQTPVTFKVYGGNVLPEYSFGVLNCSNFYDAGAINWGANGEFAATTAITIYIGGTVAPHADDYSGIYLNVDNLCAIVSGVITMPAGSQATLDGDTKLVVEDGGAILPANTAGHDLASETTLVYVDFKAESGNTQIECKDGSFTSMAINGENPISVNGNTSSGGAKFFTIDPPTAANCAATALAQTAHAVALAGGNVDCMMTIIESAGNAMVDTAAAICDGLGAAAVGTTAAAVVSQADLNQIVGMINTMKTDIVSTAIASASASTTGAISAAIGTVTLSTAAATPGAAGTSIVSTMQAYNTCDTSWYDASKSSFEISTAAQLHGLSTLVFNGVDSFYGKTITLTKDIDLDAYKPWLPIGNGQYGFRGTFDGNGKTIKNMHLDVNKTWVMMSMSGKGWNNVSYRAAKEGTAFGYQNGDKYGVAFIGVLENGGELKNVTFSACNVGFDYNWNSYAAVAVGAIRATGEDYSYDGNGYTNAGKVITGFNNGIAVYGSESNATSQYQATGQKWNGSTFDEQQTNRLSGTQSSSTSYRDRAFDGWTTKVTNVTVDETCSVYATGRCGGVVAVASGAYYNSSSYNEARAKNDNQSIFASWGTVLISGCSNGADVTHVPTQTDYEEGGGVLGYLNIRANLKGSVSNCSNSGDIKAGAAAGIVGSLGGTTPFTVDAASCSNTGTISIADTNRAGTKTHTSTVASTLYNTTTTAVGTGSTKMS